MGFTNNGYVKRTAEEIKESLVTVMQDKSPSFRGWTADIQNNLLDTATPVLLEVENLMAEMANSLAPGLANDFIWEQLASSLNLQYKEASQSSVQLRFTGETGVYIPPQTEVTGGFKTATGAIINESGFAVVTAYSETTSIYAAGKIDKIVTQLGAEVEVTNPASSLKGQPIEDNASLKYRAQSKLRNPRFGPVDIAYASILALDGTSERLTNYNFVNTDKYLGVELICGGGEASEIALVLLQNFAGLNNLVSDPSDGDALRRNEWNVKYYGSTLPVRWTTPKQLAINVSVEVSYRYVSAYKGKMEIILNELFAETLNNWKVGVPLNRYVFDGLVFEASRQMEIEPQYIATINYVLTDNATGNALTIDSAGYIVEIQKDVYPALGGFGMNIIT